MPIAENKVKNLIIEILSAEWPLTAKKIYNRIKKSHRKSISYQAVFKALKEMKEEGILKKERYDYSLSLLWINEVYSKYEDIKRAYESKPQNIFLKFIREKTFTVEFDTYYKALSTFLQVMDKLGFLTRGHPNNNYVEARHLYWPFAGTEKEQEKIKKIFGNFDAHVLCNSKTPIDRMICRHYKKLSPGIHVVLGKTVSKDHETIISGDYIGQIYYPKDFVKCLDDAYKLNSLEKVSEMFELLFNKKTKIIAVISKNPEFAELKRKAIMEVMGEL